MKTPQEIAGRAKCGVYHACRHPGCGERNDALSAEIQPYGDDRAAAVREEGRREGIEQAARTALAEAAGCFECTTAYVGTNALQSRVHCGRPGHHYWQDAACRIRALASQPKPEPADRSRGVRIELTDEQRAALTVPAGAIPKPAVTCDGCKRGLRLQCGIVPPRHFDVDGLGEYVYTPCTAKLE